jgi:hypothetical protein
VRSGTLEVVLHREQYREHGVNPAKHARAEQRGSKPIRGGRHKLK